MIFYQKIYLCPSGNCLLFIENKSFLFHKKPRDICITGFGISGLDYLSFFGVSSTTSNVCGDLPSAAAFLAVT
jgi:hypothetical protein